MKRQAAANDEESGLLCAPLPVGFPADVRAMQLRAAVSLILTEYHGVNREFFDTYGVSTLEDAVTNLRRNPETFFVYRFSLSGARPAYSRDVDRLLHRPGDLSGAKPRELISAGAPWNLVSDCTVFEIRREPVTYRMGRLRLRVGGRDEADAMTRWMAIAKPLRALYRGISPTATATATEAERLPTG